MLTASLLQLIALSSMGQGEIQPAELATKLRAMSALVEDFSCEFEGSLRYTTKNSWDRLHLPDSGLYDEFSGNYTWRNDGAAILDVYHRFAPSNDLQRQTTAAIKGEVTDYRRSSDAIQGSGTKTAIHGTEFTATASPAILLARDRLLANLGDEGFRVLQQPDEFVDSALCEVYDFVYKRGPNSTLKDAPGERFWVDMRRDGHVLKHESYNENSSHVASRLSGVRLMRVPIGNNQDAWFPSTGVGQGFMDLDAAKKLVCRDSATTVESIDVMVGTIRVNQHPDDSTFAVDSKLGTPITDRLRSSQYEFGQQRTRVTTRAAAEAQVQELLSQADAQKKDLEAASYTRSGPDLLAWSPWAIAAVACITLIVFMIRGKMAR